MPDSPIQFPTLDNGVIAQLPVRLNIETIARETRFPDGSTVVANAEAQWKYTWTLQYDNLSDAEWQRFMDFVSNTQRGAVSFAFPDPIGNLLAHSGNLEHSIWLASPGLTVEPFEDPVQAKAFIITNPTAQPLQLSQTVGLEGAFRTCFSILAKWEGGAAFEIALADGLAAASQLEVAAEWTKHSINLASSAEAETRTATITIPPTTQIIVSSPQLEISIAPGAYLETGAAGCMFSDCWLAQQAYESRNNAPGAHAITLRIESFRAI